MVTHEKEQFNADFQPKIQNVLSIEPIQPHQVTFSCILFCILAMRITNDHLVSTEMNPSCPISSTFLTIPCTIPCEAVARIQTRHFEALLIIVGDVEKCIMYCLISWDSYFIGNVYIFCTQDCAVGPP